ncbi:Intradiol ring-cleavage dioxygenase [Xylariomycetidae sp. FL2044]|nr:Intradiol ring-cleavage dioxygenase [Xylariomycetidae sp. FL2044]
MVQLTSSLLLSAAAMAATGVVAHPGHDHGAEARARAAGLANLKTRSLSACAPQLEARGVSAAAAARRAAVVAELTKKTLVTRELDLALNTSHRSNLTGVTPETDPSLLFSGNGSCALVPETTQGPYYVSGELMRSDVVEDQVGVPLYLDVQMIDTTTCEPLEGVAVDFWSCNATGSYSGISSQAGLDTTWLRGIQASDADGVVAFKSIMPGHYSGRTHHLHLLAHSPGNWSLLDNGTITGGTSTPHIGQVFFDQDLLDELETLAPYTQNTQSWTKNDEDNIVVQEAEATGVDPMAEYVLLGDSLADGVFAWISVGIDPSAVYHVDAAVYRTEDGAREDACFEMINLTPDDPPLPDPPASCTATAAATSSTASA